MLRSKYTHDVYAATVHHIDDMLLSVEHRSMIGQHRNTSTTKTWHIAQRVGSTHQHLRTHFGNTLLALSLGTRAA